MDQETTDKQKRNNTIFFAVVFVMSICFDCYFLWWLFGLLIKAQLSGPGDY